MSDKFDMRSINFENSVNYDSIPLDRDTYFDNKFTISVKII